MPLVGSAGCPYSARLALPGPLRRLGEHRGPIGAERADAEFFDGEAEDIVKRDEAGWDGGLGEGSELDLGARAQVEMGAHNGVAIFGMPMKGEQFGTFAEV